MTWCQGKQSVPQLSQRMLLILSVRKVVEWKSPVNVSRVNERLLVWILYSLKWRHWSRVSSNIEGDTELQGGPEWGFETHLYSSFKMQCGRGPVWFGKGSVTQQEHTSNFCTRKSEESTAPACLVPLPPYSCWVTKQQQGRIFPTLQKNSLWFSWKPCLTKIKWTLSCITSTLSLYKVQIKVAPIKVVNAQINSSMLPHYCSKQLFKKTYRFSCIADIYPPWKTYNSTSMMEM